MDILKSVDFKFNKKDVFYMFHMFNCNNKKEQGYYFRQGVTYAGSLFKSKHLDIARSFGDSLKKKLDSGMSSIIEPGSYGDICSEHNALEGCGGYKITPPRIGESLAVTSITVAGGDFIRDSIQLWNSGYPLFKSPVRNNLLEKQRNYYRMAYGLSSSLAGHGDMYDMLNYVGTHINQEVF